MFVGRVVGEVWASKKDPTLEGIRLLIIDPLEVKARTPSTPEGREPWLVVAADPLGAGVGEEVVVAYGRAGRVALGHGEDVAVEAAVVGIVDARNGAELA